MYSLVLYRSNSASSIISKSAPTNPPSRKPKPMDQTAHRSGSEQGAPRTNNEQGARRVTARATSVRSSAKPKRALVRTKSDNAGKNSESRPAWRF